MPCDSHPPSTHNVQSMAKYEKTQLIYAMIIKDTCRGTSCNSLWISGFVVQSSDDKILSFCQTYFRMMKVYPRSQDCSLYECESDKMRDLSDLLRLAFEYMAIA